MRKLFAVCLLSLAACTVEVATNGKKFTDSPTNVQRSVRFYEEGIRAYKAGVPAQANPYQGAYGETSSRLWMNGWLDAKEAVTY